MSPLRVDFFSASGGFAASLSAHFFTSISTLASLVGVSVRLFNSLPSAFFSTVSHDPRVHLFSGGLRVVGIHAALFQAGRAGPAGAGAGSSRDLVVSAAKRTGDGIVALE